MEHKELLTKKFPKLSEVDIEVNRLIKRCKQADKELDNGNDKIGYMMYDTPPHIVDKVKISLKEKGDYD